MDLVILIRCQMTRTTSELEPSPIFRTTPAGGHLIHMIFNVHQAHKYGESSVVSNLEPSGFKSARCNRNPFSVAIADSQSSYFSHHAAQTGVAVA
ncbi:hypothetical protein AVEN_201683-1 [Araneus ventricosus]|uniref:Uncharacterized protein n=1 Tax=Araneus ventricosus TaxID=182803 RepID=A0A4Y2F6N3_ARAVE|nr:hypothetical protein AVEN_201683-1 [Araneus ventricosus]